MPFEFQVVLFLKENAEATFGNALVITECSAEQNHGDGNNHESGIVEYLFFIFFFF